MLIVTLLRRIFHNRFYFNIFRRAYNCPTVIPSEFRVRSFVSVGIL